MAPNHSPVLRRGFTLVELLVVVATIAVLIGLLLPAVQKVREAASRCKCQSNLGNLTLGTIHYEQVFGVFPSGYQSVANNGSGQQTGWGWMVAILPYVEQEPLQRALRLDLSIAAEANAPWREKRLPLALCPSDPASESHEILMPEREPVPDNPLPPASNTIKFACSQYVGVSGTTATDAPSASGILFRDSKTKAGDVKDGLANTMLLTERSSRLGFAVWHGAIPGATMGNPRQEVHPSHKEVPNGTTFPASALTLATVRGISFLQSADCLADGMGSFHSNGINTGFSDGHVTFIPATVSGQLLSAWATRAGGEASPAP